MRKLEALADALAKMFGWHDPQSEAYRTRNPGLLKAFSQRHPSNENGRRIFDSVIDGYQALIFDLEIKCGGKSRAKLTPDSNLRDLVRAHGQPDTAADFLVKFLRPALTNETISTATPLAYFLER